MSLKRAFVVCLLLAAAYIAIDRYWPRAITEAALAEQLDGAHCRFSYEIDRCTQRGFEPLRSLLIEEHDCDLWAVQCLMAFKSPEATRELKKVLSTKTDVETCDGVSPIRSYAVEYLGGSGDRSAIEPLKALLASNPTATLSSGAAGCSARPENLTAIRAAIDKLESN